MPAGSAAMVIVFMFYVSFSLGGLNGAIFWAGLFLLLSFCPCLGFLS